MTQNEVIWALFTTLQLVVFAFVAYWTRRIQSLENTIVKSIEERTRLLVQFEGRVSRLESQFEENLRQHAQMMKVLEKIERRLDGRLDRRDDEEE